MLAALLGLLATYRAKTVPLPPGKVYGCCFLNTCPTRLQGMISRLPPHCHTRNEISEVGKTRVTEGLGRLQGLRQCQQGGPFSQRVLECPPAGHLTLVSRLQGTIKEVCVWGDASAYQIILLYTLNIYNSKLSVQPQ